MVHMWDCNHDAQHQVQKQKFQISDTLQQADLQESASQLAGADLWLPHLLEL